MAFNLSASIQSNLTSAVNTVSSSVNTVSQNINSTVLSGAALGGAAGALLAGGRGAALGALAGGVLSSGTAGDLLGQVKNKLQGLISSAGELTGLIATPLKIVERGAADLAGLTGEYGLTLDSYRQLADRSAYNDFVDTGFKNPFKGNDSSASRLPNPLRNHNGYNYKITLGVLDAAEYNNPESYRSSGGFKNYVIQSSGGNLDKRYQVFDEAAGGKQEHAEYYIEDLNIEAVIAPNGNTRVTAGTALTFTVIEPYSMGNFVQAIIGAASTAGYKNYLDAPFCLKIDFVGWNLDGSTNANFILRPIFVPIKFINMEFNVTGQGSTYAVKAVPMSESGLADNVNKANTPIKASGTILHEVLETSDTSVTAAINGQLQELEKSGALSPFDRFLVVFPKTRTALVDALKTGTITESAFTTTATTNAQQQKGSTKPIQGATHSADKTLPNITIKPVTKTYAILKTFAENTGLMNEIGLSPINTDTNAAGNSTEASPSATINPKTNKVDPAAQSAQSADKARDYQFGQGEKITSIIEKLVIQTEYAAEKSTEGAKNGLNKWFKIDTQVFIDESPVTEAQMGRKPKVYVYSVVPFEVDEAVHAGPGQKPGNTQGLKNAVAKEFNYIYTGKNEDVLNFDINFNQAFMQTALANFGMNKGGQASVDSAKTASAQKQGDSGAASPTGSDAKSNDDPGGTTQYTDRLGESAGSASKDIRRQIAEMFHDRITNMTTDMITAEMEIMGDPFFIPQETGNYVAKAGDKPNTTNDGTMTYQQSQVFCVVNFKTPFDYQVKGATMEMPQVVPGFSGLFIVWAVTCTFSKGQFKQILKLIRRKGQADPATTGNTSFVQTDNKVAIANKTTESDGTVGQSGKPSTDCFPAPPADDIRKLMPAVPQDVANKTTAPFKQIEASISSAVPKIKEAVAGIDFNVAKAPDLSKIIPALGGAAISGLSNALGSTVSGALGGSGLGGAVGSAIGGAIGNLKSQANAASSTVNSAVNTAANQAIAATSNATTSKIKNLLG